MQDLGNQKGLMNMGINILAISLQWRPDFFTITQILSLDFSLAQGTTLQAPTLVAEQTYRNPSSVTMPESFSYTKTQSKTSQFSYTDSNTLTIEAGVSFTAGIPGVDSETMEIKTTASTT
jgi:hypothetical protein